MMNTDKINVFWFRRDLRLNDNHGLYRALMSGLPVLPVFIFDQDILDKLDGPEDARVSFIYREIVRMKHVLESNGSSLVVKYGRPAEVFSDLAREYRIERVFTNHDYEPYARERDEMVRKVLGRLGIHLETCKDQVIFEMNDILKEDGRPYTVFTPYSRKWRELFSRLGMEYYPSEKHTGRFCLAAPLEIPVIPGFKMDAGSIHFPEKGISLEKLQDYHNTRDFPFLDGTSRLGIHLRFGTISIRQLVREASTISPVFLNELIWREFYMMILYHFPHVISGAFKPLYDRISWRNDEKHFQAWCQGLTGYPIVDAGMRELNQTGYMHNRVRMITASFLAKHLLIDWRWGEAYFAKKLLDFELASNNGGWQWAAGTGCDAAPYFRVFNPDLQTNKFDPDLIYTKRWVKELGTKEYPGERIVEHKTARELALKVYKQALSTD